MSNSWVLILFNLVFTSAPPLVYSILDQDIAATTLLKLPELYRAEQKCKVTEDMAADRTHIHLMMGSDINSIHLTSIWWATAILTQSYLLFLTSGLWFPSSELSWGYCCGWTVTD